MSSKTAELIDICDLITDGTHYTPKDVGSGVAFLTVKDMDGDTGLNFENCSYISVSDYQQAAQGNSAPKFGDVLFSKDGTVGKVHVVKTSKEFAVLSSIAILRPNTSVLDSTYLGFALKSPSILNDALSRKTGSAIRRIVLSDLKKVRIPLPPLSEQKRIAAILDKADEIRRKREAAIAKLDQLAQSIFVEMFGDDVVNNKEWDINQLQNLVDQGDTINYGVVQPGDDFEIGIPLIRVNNLVSNNFAPNVLKQIDPKIEAAYKRSRLRGDEILVSCVGTIGVVALVEQEQKGYNIARAVARIPLSKRMNRIFVANYLRSAKVQNYFTAELRTVSQPTLNIKQLSETLIMCPPLVLQEEFAKRINKLEQLKADNVAALTKQNQLFATLQHQAFTGNL